MTETSSHFTEKLILGGAWLVVSWGSARLLILGL